MNAPATQPTISVGGFSIDILVQGFPGKTVCHGGLGWSTVALVRGRGPGDPDRRRQFRHAAARSPSGSPRMG